jgi:hypothetical protein
MEFLWSEFTLPGIGNMRAPCESPDTAPAFRNDDDIFPVGWFCNYQVHKGSGFLKTFLKSQVLKFGILVCSSEIRVQDTRKKDSGEMLNYQLYAQGV